MISIDGSQGEGGGQILRTSLAMSAALGRNVRVTRIRAGRPRSGLRPQHLAAARAAAVVCGGELQGDEIGSQEITFCPGTPRAGQYRFDIGTAGSTTLLCQTVLPPLMLASGESDVTVTGGTHNPMAPCFEYLRDVFGVLASAANAQAYFELVRAGFAPAGGGELRMRVQGLGQADYAAPLRFVSRGELKYIEGVSLVSRSLPEHVAERQARQALARLASAGRRATLEQAIHDSDCPGSAVFLRAAFTRSVAGFSALGQRGKPAEAVADEAVDALLAFLDSDGAVDARAADQLLTLAALSPQRSSFRTRRVSEHLLTNAAVLRQMTDRNVQIDGERDGPADVTVPEV